MAGEHPVSMWHVYFDEYNAGEETAGENELKALQDISWEAVEHLSLENLARANDFKPPKKVGVLKQVYVDRGVRGYTELEYTIRLDVEDIA